LDLPSWVLGDGGTGSLGRWRAVCVRGRAAVSGVVPIFLCILPLALGDLLDCLWAQSPRASGL
jgi:hypothetical protein